MNNDQRKNKSALIIRDMTVADLPAIVSLELSIFTDPWPGSAFQNHFDNIDCRALVADRDGSVIGYACCCYSDNQGHLTNIAVSPDSRRKSVATQLLKAILSIVNECGCDQLLLEVRPSNVAARVFYRRFGFVRRYRRRQWYNDPVEDALVLVRQIERSEEIR